MKTAANLYKQHKSDAQSVWRPDAQIPKDEEFEATKRKNKEEARRKAKEEKEAAERLKKESTGKQKSKKKPFNFEEVRQYSLNIILREAAELSFYLFRRNRISSRRLRVPHNPQITSSMLSP